MRASGLFSLWRHFWASLLVKRQDESPGSGWAEVVGSSGPAGSLSARTENHGWSAQTCWKSVKIRRLSGPLPAAPPAPARGELTDKPGGNGKGLRGKVELKKGKGKRREGEGGRQAERETGWPVTGPRAPSVRACRPCAFPWRRRTGSERARQPIREQGEALEADYTRLQRGQSREGETRGLTLQPKYKAKTKNTKFSLRRKHCYHFTCHRILIQFTTWKTTLSK